MVSRKMSIHRTILVYQILVTVISVLLIGYLWISSERLRFASETNMLRGSYIDEQKQVLKREVDRAMAFIRYMQAQTEMRLKENVKDRVYEAHGIASNIYKQNEQSMPKENIAELIKDALRPIRFSNNRGYYFAFDMKGVETLFPVKPEAEGQNMINVTGGNGEYVVKDMLDLVNQQNESFYSYSWLKPGSEGYYPKIAFVRFFEPLGWVIGTGEYVEDVKKDIQKECITWISNITFGNEGYVFAGDYDGLSLSGPQAGKNMYGVEDIHGVKIVQKLIMAAKTGGGFVDYVVPGFEGVKHASKISYAAGIDEWRWYIGAGVYVDEIETEIAQKQVELEGRIRMTIRNIAMILFFLFVLMFFLVKFFSGRIHRNMSSFMQFFARASSDAVKIDDHALYFSEFVEIARSANEMIDQRIRAADALHMSHKRFLTVLDSIDATIYVADMETHEILFMNKHMVEEYGGDKTGQACFQAFTGKSRPCIHCTNKKLVDDEGQPTDVCVSQGVNPVNGKWYVNYDRAIEWIDGRLVRLQIATDITELKKMEEDLHQARKMEAVGNLAGGVAHEFNNVLSIIVGNVELMLSDVPKDDALHKKLIRIMDASLRARDVVKQLLDFSRKIDSEKIPIDMRDIVSDALTLLKASIPSNIEIREIIPPELDAVMADLTQIHQVLINLCNNAAQAMGDGGILTIELCNVVSESENSAEFGDGEPGPKVRLSVRDTGMGIHKDSLSRIFDPYFTTKGIGKGTGMGLAVVHGIVKDHHGFIRVETTSGEGTSFHVYFPSCHEKAVRKAVDVETTPMGTETILFVDDELFIVDLYRSILEKLGYRVIAETDPRRALSVFQSSPRDVDLVISDMTMPFMTGDRFAGALLDIRPELPIIVCTGFSENISPEKARAIGIKEVLMKPVGAKRLGTQIRHILDKAKVSRQ